ncbi:Uncharacterised protein [Vibrio cholerae]|nr:Uncharacterised protein [Vibrio cholerae]
MWKASTFTKSWCSNKVSLKVTCWRFWRKNLVIIHARQCSGMPVSTLDLLVENLGLKWRITILKSMHRPR